MTVILNFLSGKSYNLISVGSVFRDLFTFIFVWSLFPCFFIFLDTLLYLHIRKNGHLFQFSWTASYNRRPLRISPEILGVSQIFTLVQPPFFVLSSPKLSRVCQVASTSKSDGSSLGTFQTCWLMRCSLSLCGGKWICKFSNTFSVLSWGKDYGNCQLKPLSIQVARLCCLVCTLK